MMYAVGVVVPGLSKLSFQHHRLLEQPIDKHFPSWLNLEGGGLGGAATQARQWDVQRFLSWSRVSDTATVVTVFCTCVVFQLLH